MKITNRGLRALTTSKERQELRAVGQVPLKLQYVGKMAWADKYGIDSRMWNVVSPRLPEYDYSSGGLPTLTTQGLKERGIIS